MSRTRQGQAAIQAKRDTKSRRSDRKPYCFTLRLGAITHFSHLGYFRDKDSAQLRVDAPAKAGQPFLLTAFITKRGACKCKESVRSGTQPYSEYGEQQN